MAPKAGKKMKTMKNFTPTTALKTASAIFIFLSLSIPAAWANSILVCEKQVHDFGYTTQGNLVSHSFELVNIGTEPVVITKVAPSLLLINVSIAKTTIAPNEHVVLKMEYDSRYGMGQVEPITVLTTSDPANPTMTFKMTGHVFSQASMGPARSSNAVMEASPRMMEPPARAVGFVWMMVSTFLGIR